MKTSPSRLTLPAIALSFPVILLYAAHVFHAWRQELHPTGFIQYDQPYYVDLDRQGNLVTMTIEHARTNARLQEFSYQEVVGRA